MILINLLPPELKRKETPKVNLPEIPVKKTLLIIAAVVLVIQSLMSVGALFYAVRYRMTVQESEKLVAELSEVRKLKSKTVSVGNRLKELKNLTNRPFFWSSILNELTQTATKGIWLRSMRIEEQTVEVAKKADPASASQGTTKKKEVTRMTVRVLKLEGSCGGGSGQETALIGKYLKSVKDSAYFRDLFDFIDLSNINQRKVSDYDVFDFTVNCRFKKGKF